MAKQIGGSGLPDALGNGVDVAQLRRDGYRLGFSRALTSSWSVDSLLVITSQTS
jgi:hypothetical protein